MYPDQAPDASPAPPPGRPWRRILITALAVVAAVALVGLFLVIETSGDDDRKDTANGGGNASATATTAPAPGESDSEHGDDEVPRDTDGNPIPENPPPPPASISGKDGEQTAPAGAKETAEGFGRAFTNTSGGQTAWYNRLAVFLTPAKAAEYKNVPIDAVPQGSLTKTEIDTPGDRVAQAVLTYDTGLVLNLTLAHDGDKWQVTKIDRPGPNVGATS